ncbi:hypothetical protein Tsubulata_050396, partial [Turnera subulata]
FTCNYNVHTTTIPTQLQVSHRERPVKMMVGPKLLMLPQLKVEARSQKRSLPKTAAAGEGRGFSLPPLDLTEDNVTQFGQIFDTSVGMTGEAELADLDGPFVKIRLKGRFWHKRSSVLARLGNYLKQRIPEILEVDIEDEKQLDDSPENF